VGGGGGGGGHRVPGGGGDAQDPPYDVGGVEPGHHEVQHEHVRLHALHQVRHLEAARRLAHDREVGLGGEQGPQPLPHHVVVLGQHDADGLHSALLRNEPCSGTSAVSRTPRPGLVSTVKWPFRSAARSRRPARPPVRPALTVSGSKPAPGSSARPPSTSSVAHRRTVTSSTWPWRATLVSASCTMRYTAVSVSAAN